jgi:hypothetical protein
LLISRMAWTSLQTTLIGWQAGVALTSCSLIRKKLSSYCLVHVNCCNKGQLIFNCRSLERPYVQQNVLKIWESSSTKIFPMMSIPAKLYLRVTWH